MSTGDRWCHICGKFVIKPCHHGVSYGIEYDPMEELRKRIERLETTVFGVDKPKPVEPLDE